MAGSLRAFDMPNLTPSAKKRERTDGQDQLWKSVGITFEPVGGIIEENEAAAKAQELREAEAEGDDTTTQKKSFLDNLKKAIGLRTDPDTPEWKQVVSIFNDYNNPNYNDQQREKLLKDLTVAYDIFHSTPPPPMIPTVPSKKLDLKPSTDKALEQTVFFAENVLQMGLSYVNDFVGMLGTRLADRDLRNYYKWKGKGATQEVLQSPLEIDTNVTSIEDLIRKNMHLGREMCAVILDQYRIFKEKEVKVKIENSINLDTAFGFALQSHGDALDVLLETQGIEDETGGFINGVKKDWVFGLLDLSAVAHILSVGTMGAMSLAVGQIRRIPGCAKFTLKQLLMSEGVRDIFAIFVAYQYLMSSGGNAYAGRASSQGNAKGTTFMLSAGLETRKMLYAQIETAQYWFRDVYETDNPVRKQLEAHKNEMFSKRAVLARNVLPTATLDAIDALMLNSKTLIEELNKILARLPEVSPTRDYIENIRNVYRLEKLLAGLPTKILRYAN